jgi:hypothetical protein
VRFIRRASQRCGTNTRRGCTKRVRGRIRTGILRLLFFYRPALLLSDVIHVREVGEGLCLTHAYDLTLLEHHTCDQSSQQQKWIYDPASDSIKLEQDTSQCLDFFLEHQDFGIWSCADAANHEFEPDHAGKLCLIDDPSKWVQNATAGM